jgi:hypothetical protein
MLATTFLYFVAFFTTSPLFKKPYVVKPIIYSSPPPPPPIYIWVEEPDRRQWNEPAEDYDGDSS